MCESSKMAMFTFWNNMANKKLSQLGSASALAGAELMEVSQTGNSKKTTLGAVRDFVIAALASTLGLKAPLASPALTGVPTAPTAVSGTNTTQVATTAFVRAMVVDHLADPTDATKQAVFSVSGIPTGTTRTVTIAGAGNSVTVIPATAPMGQSVKGVDANGGLIFG